MTDGNDISMQLVDRDGVFKKTEFEHFLKKVKMADYGIQYAVVSIMGPQSSGKSTLLNHLFGTQFRQMDAQRGRSQTTRGIWLAKCAGIDPFTLVMDLEGTDGRERGEDDTAFEKQSALFALAVSDILLINMWCHDLGRSHAANKPLLKTIFQVMLKLFGQEAHRKSTLVFVLRDKTKTPLESFKVDIMTEITKIWEDVPKSQAHRDTYFSDYFSVKVKALSNYEEKQSEFEEEVEALRKEFHGSIAPGGLAGDRRYVVPASGFAESVQNIWKLIKENKDLDLPAHKILVATVLCERISMEKIDCMKADEDWRKLQNGDQQAEFGKKLNEILYKYLSEYDEEVIYYDENVRSQKREFLEWELVKVVQRAYDSNMKKIQSETWHDFREKLKRALGRGDNFANAARESRKSSLLVFDKRVKSEDAAIDLPNQLNSAIILEKLNPSGFGNDLQGDMDNHIALVHDDMLNALTSEYKKELKKYIEEPAKKLLTGADNNTWPGIRELLGQVTESRIYQNFSSALLAFDLKPGAKDRMIKDLEEYAKGVVETEARSEEKEVLSRMKKRFRKSLEHKSSLSVWKRKRDVNAVAETARLACLRLLSVMAAIRLTDKADKIENILTSALIVVDASSSPRLISNTWDEAYLPSNTTLISPIRCKELWDQFLEESRQLATQEINKQGTKTFMDMLSGATFETKTRLTAFAKGLQHGYRKAISDVKEKEIGEIINAHSNEE